MVVGKLITNEGRMDPIILLLGSGEHIQAGANTVVMKATEVMTGGSFSMSETT